MGIIFSTVIKLNSTYVNKTTKKLETVQDFVQDQTTGDIKVLTLGVGGKKVFDETFFFNNFFEYVGNCSNKHPDGEKLGDDQCLGERP